MGKLQKRILIILLIMALLTPVGIFLPVFFEAGDAWGEWSAETVKAMIGYVPEGLARYTDLWKAPLPDYSFGNTGSSLAIESVFYILSGILGAGITLLLTNWISKLVVKHGK